MVQLSLSTPAACSFVHTSTLKCLDLNGIWGGNPFWPPISTFPNRLLRAFWPAGCAHADPKQQRVRAVGELEKRADADLWGTHTHTHAHAHTTEQDVGSARPASCSAHRSLFFREDRAKSGAGGRGQPFVIGGSSLVMLEGREGNPF